jgi:hypothetical protein
MNNKNVTGASVRNLRKFLSEEEGLTEDEDIFYLAQSLAFMLHSMHIEKLSFLMKSNRHRFALRKLISVLSLISKVFSL